MSDFFTEKCVQVEDGDTFKTDKDNWIRLARVSTPESGESNYEAAKALLANLIGNSYISYKPVGTSYNRIVAEVWHSGDNVNDYMIERGFEE